MNLVVSKIPTEWKKVGIQLGVPTEQLQAIERDNPRDCSNCWIPMFSQWREGTSPCTWAEVLQALESRSVDKPAIANEVRQWLESQ